MKKLFLYIIVFLSTAFIASQDIVITKHGVIAEVDANGARKDKAGELPRWNFEFTNEGSWNLDNILITQKIPGTNKYKVLIPQVIKEKMPLGIAENGSLRLGGIDLTKGIKLSFTTSEDVTQGQRFRVYKIKTNSPDQTAYLFLNKNGLLEKRLPNVIVKKTPSGLKLDKNVGVTITRVQ